MTLPAITLLSVAVLPTKQIPIAPPWLGATLTSPMGVKQQSVAVTAILPRTTITQSQAATTKRPTTVPPLAEGSTTPPAEIKQPKPKKTAALPPRTTQP